jgi:hypothetical protein
VSAINIDGDNTRKQKAYAGVRWGNYNLGHLYLEAGLGRAQFVNSSRWQQQSQV